MAELCAGCREPDVLRLLGQHVPNAELVANVGTEMTFRVPFSAAQHFPGLFDALDASRQALGVENYGVSGASCAHRRSPSGRRDRLRAVTTLEEVFIRIAHEDHQLSELVRGACVRGGALVLSRARAAQGGGGAGAGRGRTRRARRRARRRT